MAPRSRRRTCLRSGKAATSDSEDTRQDDADNPDERHDEPGADAHHLAQSIDLTPQRGHVGSRFGVESLRFRSPILYDLALEPIESPL